MKKFLRYIGSFLFFLLPVILIINCVEIFVFKENNLFKYQPAIILSGSMEPTLSIDDLVFTKKTSKIKKGDIISFYDKNGTMIMHRVVEVKGNDITTKGDANNTLDKPIKRSDVVGVYTGKIKYVGKIFKFIKSIWGLVICLLCIIIVFFFPSGKKKEKQLDEKKEVQTKDGKINRTIVVVIIYIILLFGCIIVDYYSKYQKNLSGDDKGVVASWSNNIELLSSDTIHFQNGKKNTNLITFNLIYESEVAAYYNISLDNISKELGIELSDGETTLSIKQANNAFIVDFNSNVETFDISELQRDQNIVLNNIEATYEVNNSKDVYIFKDSVSNKIIKIIVSGDSFDLKFENFGKFQVNDSHTKQFTLKMSAIKEELPILNNVELYATFEQID